LIAYFPIPRSSEGCYGEGVFTLTYDREGKLQEYDAIPYKLFLNNEEQKDINIIYSEFDETYEEGPPLRTYTKENG
jgi:hypothetical protein